MGRQFRGRAGRIAYAEGCAEAPRPERLGPVTVGQRLQKGDDGEFFPVAQARSPISLLLTFSATSGAGHRAPGTSRVL